MSEILEEPPVLGHTVAVFAGRLTAQEKGWEQVVSEAGRLCAENRWRVLVLAEGDNLCRPLLQAARRAGAEVLVVADEVVEPASLPKGVLLEVIEDADTRLMRVSDVADGFLILPTTLASIRDLHKAWVLAGGGSGGRPVAMLNRNRAYEVFRGFTQDILNQSLANSDRLLMFADTVEDLLPRLQRALDMQT